MHNLRISRVCCFSVLLIFFTASCEDDPARPPAEELSIESLSIDGDFDFANSRIVRLNLSVNDMIDQPISGTRFEVYTAIHDDPAQNTPFLTGSADDEGRFTTGLNIGSHINHLFVGANVPGFINLVEVPIIGNNATCSFGGAPEGLLNYNDNHQPLDADQDHFPDPVITDGNMSVIIHNVSGVQVLETSEVACLTPNELVAGLTTLEGDSPWGMAVWKDDQLTEERDGFLFQEQMRFLYWDPVYDAELDVELNVINMVEPIFQVNGLLVVDMLIEPPGGYRFLGSWDNDGVPNYLTEGNVAFNGSFLRRLALNLPEGYDLGTTNPDFISNQLENSITLTDSAEIRVSLVHDGSQRQNALGFYTYPTGQRPNSPEDIQDRIIIFPNASFYGNGGGLTTGNRVSLGWFGENTSIGWFLVLDGWENRSVGDGEGIIYTDPILNGGIGSPVQQAVLLVDDQSAQIVLGFEDQLSGDVTNDSDFNDVIFALTSSPFGGLSLQGMPVLTDDISDLDQDGVPDVEDNYPNDNEAAFYSITPVDRGEGQLAFEDRWPSVDDYDFNDLILGYRFTMVMDSAGLVSWIESQFRIIAAGSGSHNGFGFQLPIDPGAVGSVSGYNLIPGIVNLEGNGVEAGQSKAVVMVFDDVLRLASPAGGFNFVNTEPNSPLIEVNPIDMRISFVDPVNPADLGMPPWNAFIFDFDERGREIHLADHPSTDIVNPDLFGAEADRSFPDGGRYYRSAHNLPWAFDLPGGWRHPVEGTQLLLAYPFFANWAESGGMDVSGWYLPLPGNFNEDYVWE